MGERKRLAKTPKQVTDVPCYFWLFLAGIVFIIAWVLSRLGTAEYPAKRRKKY